MAIRRIKNMKSCFAVFNDPSLKEKSKLKRFEKAQQSAYLSTCPICGTSMLHSTAEGKTAGYTIRKLREITNIFVCYKCGYKEAFESYDDDLMIPLSEWALFTGKNLIAYEDIDIDGLYQFSNADTRGTITLLGSFDKMLFSGIHLKGSTFYEGGQNFLRDAQAGTRNLTTKDIYLKRDLTNEKDRNAVQIWCKSDGLIVMMGYVDAKQVPIIAECIDTGGRIEIVQHKIYGEADSFCGLFLTAELTFPDL